MGNAAPGQAATAKAEDEDNPDEEDNPNEIRTDNRADDSDVRAPSDGDDVGDDSDEGGGLRIMQSSDGAVTEDSPFKENSKDPQLGEPIRANPLDSTTVPESVLSEEPAGSDMRSPAELPAGTIMPSDSHGYSGEKDELGQRDGDGVQMFPDGRRFSGQFQANTFNGAGIMVWPDGHRYTGQYENNHKSGEGFFLWPDGRFYDGQWRMGQRHGHGQYIAAESYVGEYYEGFRHGDGVLTWPDGKRYAGQFFRGSLHGSAVMTWSDGRQYLGQYVDNQKQGEGMFYWPDGRLYEGQWRKGLRHGSSRFIDSSGAEHAGSWHKDRLVASRSAADPGVRDPYCEAPVTLLAQRPSKFKTELPKVDEEEPTSRRAERKRTQKSSMGADEDFAARQAGAGALSPQTRQEIDADDIVLEPAWGSDEEKQNENAPQGKTVTAMRRGNSLEINGMEHKCHELHELRAMSHQELRDHADDLHVSFREHDCTPVPEEDHGLLGWTFDVQSRFLKPIMHQFDEHYVFKDVVVMAAETVTRTARTAAELTGAVKQYETTDTIRKKWVENEIQNAKWEGQSEAPSRTVKTTKTQKSLGPNSVGSSDGLEGVDLESGELTGLSGQVAETTDLTGQLPSSNATDAAASHHPHANRRRPRRDQGGIAEEVK